MLHKQIKILYILIIFMCNNTFIYYIIKIINIFKSQATNKPCGILFVCTLRVSRPNFCAS